MFLELQIGSKNFLISFAPRPTQGLPKFGIYWPKPEFYDPSLVKIPL